MQMAQAVIVTAIIIITLLELFFVCLEVRIAFQDPPPPKIKGFFSQRT